MTLETLMQKAAQQQITRAAVEAFCQAERIGHRECFDGLARHIATAYASNRLSWLDGDTAANEMMAVSVTGFDDTLPDGALSVFLAFDAGEYSPNTPNLTPDEVTRSLINDFLNGNHLA